MEKTYYILQKEAYSIYPQVDCLSVFQAQQISSWKIFSGIKPFYDYKIFSLTRSIFGYIFRAAFYSFKNAVRGEEAEACILKVTAPRPAS